MKLLGWIFLLLTLFSFGYAISIICYSGWTTAFLWFWFMLGFFSAALDILILYIHHKKIVIPSVVSICAYAIVLVGIGIFMVVQGVLIHNGRKEPKVSADYMIVLGAQVRGTTISRALKNRLDTAYDYWLENKETIVIVSGGKGPGEDITEAKAMHDYLVYKGMDESKIIEEASSTNTNENIIFSKKYMNSEEAKALIVTNDFHVYRATQIAKKQGLLMVNGLGAPSDDILFINYYVREFFALLKDKVVGNI